MNAARAISISMPPSLPPRVPLVAVEIGNTLLHLGLFRSAAAKGLPRPEATLSLPTRGEDWSVLDAWPLPEGAAWRVTSVHRQAERRLAAFVAERFPTADYCVLGWQELPLEVRLSQPERVGMD